MKHFYVLILVIVLLLIRCVPKETPTEQTPKQPEEQSQEQIDEQKALEETEEKIIQQEKEIEEQAEKIEEQEEVIPLVQEKPELSEEEQIQQISGYSKTKIHSYYYTYKDPSGRQYKIYVKGNKMRIGYLSSENKIYIDTGKKTAEEWCISYTKCGRQTGKIADLDYYDAYIDTPIDWLPKITEAKKIDDGVYYGKQAWDLNTNIGEVIIDSNFGFIYSIKQKDKEYSFRDASFNTVQDSDVNVPEYLLST